MLRKSAIAIAVSLACLSGQAFAQQSAVKSAVASSVERVGAPAGQVSKFDDTDLWIYLVFGIATVAIIWAANDDDSEPVSP